MELLRGSGDVDLGIHVNSSGLCMACTLGFFSISARVLHGVVALFHRQQYIKYAG